MAPRKPTKPSQLFPPPLPPVLPESPARWLPLFVAAAAMLLFSSPTTARGDAVSFRKHIAPMLIEHCLACHRRGNAKGGYRLDTFHDMLQPGESDAPPVTPGKPDDSELLRLLITHDREERMPKNADTLPAAVIARTRQWVMQGATLDAAPATSPAAPTAAPTGDDRRAPLLSLVPTRQHPAAPRRYPRPLPITAIAFSRDGKRLYTAGYHEVMAWSDQGKLIRRIGQMPKRTLAIAIHEKSSAMVVAGGNPGTLGELRLFDLNAKDPAASARVLATAGDELTVAAFSPDATRLIAAGTRGRLWLFEIDLSEDGGVRSAVKLWSDQVHVERVNTIAWSKDGKRLITASNDRSVKVLALTKDGDRLTDVTSYLGHGNAVIGAGFDADGQRGVSVARDGRIHRWVIDSAKREREARVAGGTPHAAQVIGDDIWVGGSDGKVYRYATRELKPTKDAPILSGGADALLSLSYHAESKRVAGGGFDGVLLLWNSSDAKPVLRQASEPQRP